MENYDDSMGVGMDAAYPSFWLGKLLRYYGVTSSPQDKKSARLGQDYGPNAEMAPPMAKGGHIAIADKISREKSRPCHVGLITMAVGGRTDHIPMNVLEGSYVLPADIVSGLGEGNTLAGTKLIDKMFNSGPFGLSAKAPTFAAVPKPSLGEYGSMQSMFGTQNLGQINAPQKAAAGGGPVLSGKYRPVPIVAAGGEYVIHPDVVKKLGNGDMERGHNYLDNFVKGVRKHLIKTLSKLPGPRRD
jgi:hypothetical protein